MAAEIISEIKKVEQEAKELMVKANKDSKEIINNATLEANLKYNEILDIAKSEAKIIIDNAILEASKEADVLFEKGQADCKLISNALTSKVDEAVNLVIERIVNIHGNS